MDKKEVVNAIIKDDKEQFEVVPNLPEIRETTEEHNSLDLAKKARGDGWAVSLDNLEKILSGDSKLKGALQYNEFTYEIDITKPLKLNGKRSVTGVADDVALKEIRLYIAKKYKIDFKKSDISDALEVVAGANAYNPLKSYLLECEEEYKHLPEQKEPFDILRYYLNVEDDEYNRLIFDLFFRGAVAKVFDPGVKFDFVLDLTGKQGIGKTEFFEGLFKEHYTLLESFTEKDDKARMVRNWCALDDEMVATNKTSFEYLKRFITDRIIEYRPPYGSTDRRLLKNFVIVRTTNERDYLNDLTGVRRFLVAEVFKDSNYRGRSWNESDRRTFWGGMMQSWRANKVLTLTEEQEKLVSARREGYKRLDDDIELLDVYLETPYPKRLYLLPLEDKVRNWYIFDTVKYGKFQTSKYYDPIKHGELVERDKMTIPQFFEDMRIKDPKENRVHKVKMAMQNRKGWKSKKVRLGNTSRAGFKKET